MKISLEKLKYGQGSNLLGTTDREQISFVSNLSVTKIGHTAGATAEAAESGQVESLLKASLVYHVISRPVRDTQQDLVSEEKRKENPGLEIAQQ